MWSFLVSLFLTAFFLLNLGCAAGLHFVAIFGLCCRACPSWPSLDCAAGVALVAVPELCCRSLTSWPFMDRAAEHLVAVFVLACCCFVTVLLLFVGVLLLCCCCFVAVLLMFCYCFVCLTIVCCRRVQNQRETQHIFDLPVNGWERLPSCVTAPPTAVSVSGS